MSFPQPLEGEKLRGKPEKFADHYTQASLFYESQTDVEKAHTAGGFRFELSKVTVPAMRERMVASLVNVSADLAASVAAGLGMAVPKALPKVLAGTVAPEVVRSSALSLTALPGDGGIRTRKVAFLVADAVHGASIIAMVSALATAGAAPCVIAPRLGRVKTADGKPLEAAGTLENSALVLFDALVLPDRVDGLAELAGRPQTMDFIRDQYRHGKTILALGASKNLLVKAGISTKLPSGRRDRGVLLAGVEDDASAAFIAAVGEHRHAERDAALLGI